MRTIRVTESLCPKCLRTLKAEIYEKGGAVYIKKRCPEHGKYEDIYWSDYELYKWAEGYAHEGTPLENPQTRALKNCFFNCGLCPNHKSHTVLAIIDVTSRCNLSCPGCFAASGEYEYVYEPTKEQVRQMIRRARASRPIPPTSLQFSGGEPTLRDDLPDLIRIADEEGIRHIEVNTNGIRIADDVDYFKRLIDAGMSTIYLQFDSLRPEAIRKLRKVDILSKKLRVIENARKLGFESIVLVVTLAKGINDRDLGDIINFAIKNRDVVRCVNVQPISFAGRGERLDPKAYRITVSNFMRLVEEQTDGKVRVTDFRPVPWPIPIARAVGILRGKLYPEFSAAPWCGVATFLVPRGKDDYVPITKLVDVDKFAEALVEAGEEAKKGHKVRSKIRVIGALRHVKLSALRSLALDVVTSGSYEALGKFMRKVVMLGCMHFMDRMNLDLSCRLQYCVIHYLTPNPKHPIIPFCSYNNYWRPIIEKEYSIPYAKWRAQRAN